MKRWLYVVLLTLGASALLAQSNTVVLTSGPTVDQVTEHSATLRWTTNKVAATRVNYGTDPSQLVQHAYRPGGSTGHEVMLQNLQPHTNYYFEIENRYGRDRMTGNFTTN